MPISTTSMCELKCTQAPLPFLAARDHVPARVLVAVTRRAFGPDEFHFEAAAFQALGQELADFQVTVARRIERGNADQGLRQFDQVVASRLDFPSEPVRLCDTLIHNFILSLLNAAVLQYSTAQRSIAIW
ncbi:hypothetical protein [Fodinicurvata halophila]|uniref:hypothetical protein n=1 Tax=Fodinicurvata halophila TaxID=1419723 RepID=UPI00363240DD